MTIRRPTAHLRCSASRGFTLIELLAVVAILGILASLAVGAYTKNVRAAHRTEVIGDLSHISLRQQALMSVRGHYASTSVDEDDTYPIEPGALKTKTGTLGWDIAADGYTRADIAADTPYFRLGGNEHGYDALNFIPENNESWCVYGIISGDGTEGGFGDEPPDTDIANGEFGTDELAIFYQRDWFYAFAKCDFDRDGVLWEFSTTHYRSDVATGDSPAGE